MNSTELNNGLNQLNVLFPNPYEKWQFTTANKDHTDEFGVEIKRNDVYFKRETGARSSDKLSMKSMEQLIMLLFYSNVSLSSWTEEAYKEEEKRMADSIREAKNKIFNKVL